MKSKSSIIALISAILVIGLCGWDAYEAKITNMQNEGIAALEASVNIDDYREAEQAQISDIITDTTAKIRETRDANEVKALVEAAASEFAELKTDAQYTAEEEAARKAELERKRKEEEARKKAEAEAAAAAAAQARKKSGKKKSYLAEKCNISIQTLRLKIIGKYDFTTTEVRILCEELGITDAKLMQKIFFKK